MRTTTMAKIYPDTNRFVDFYRTSSEKLIVLDELLKNKVNVVLTEQTITEFRRNRITALQILVRQFQETNDIGNPDKPPLLRELLEYKELSKLLDKYKEKRKAVLSQLKQLIADEQKDPVAQKFLALATDAAVEKLKLTNEVIERAYRRKLLGNPPCSPDKYTVGDEVIWEMLIENMKDDLIVVTEDHTFHDNLSLLGEEYRNRTGRKLLLVTKNLGEALKTIGQAPSKELIEVEKKEEESLPPLGWLDTSSDANYVIQAADRWRRASHYGKSSQSDDGWLAAVTSPSPAPSSPASSSPTNARAPSPSPLPSPSPSAVSSEKEGQP
jgi:hypothetical protein